MTDHIAEAGKMVSDRVVMLRTIAAMLDHPSVYMGGPSQRNMRRAEEILAAVAPIIAAAERGRCAEVLQKQLRIIYARKVIGKTNREVAHVLAMCRAAIRALP